jgi:hypothetical protein
VTKSILHYVLEYLRKLPDKGNRLLVVALTKNQLTSLHKEILYQPQHSTGLHLSFRTRNFYSLLQTINYFKVKEISAMPLTSIICTMRYSVGTRTGFALPSRPSTKLFTTHVPLKPSLKSASSNIATEVLNLDNRGQTHDRGLNNSPK